MRGLQRLLRVEHRRRQRSANHLGRHERRGSRRQLRRTRPCGGGLANQRNQHLHGRGCPDCGHSRKPRHRAFEHGRGPLPQFQRGVECGGPQRPQRGTDLCVGKCRGRIVRLPRGAQWPNRRPYLAFRSRSHRGRRAIDRHRCAWVYRGSHHDGGHPRPSPASKHRVVGGGFVFKRRSDHHHGRPHGRPYPRPLVVDVHVVGVWKQRRQLHGNL